MRKAGAKGLAQKAQHKQPSAVARGACEGGVVKTVNGVPKFEEKDLEFISIKHINEELQSWGDKRKCISCKYWEFHAPKYCYKLGSGFMFDKLQTFSCAAFEVKP